MTTDSTKQDVWKVTKGDSPIVAAAIHDGHDNTTAQRVAFVGVDTRGKSCVSIGIDSFYLYNGFYKSEETMQENENLVPENSSQASTTPMQPLTVTDILVGMFTLYRNHFRLFLGIVVVYFVFGYVIDKISVYLVLDSLSAVNFMTLFWALLGSILLSVFVVGGLSYASAHVFLGRNITAGAALRQSLQRYIPFLGCFLIYSLVVFGLSITIIGIPFAIYLAIRWSLYTLPILFEGTPILTSLRRSTELVKGNWWRVFGNFLAVFLIYQMILSILVNSFGLVFLLITGNGDVQNATLLETILRIFVPTPSDIGWTAYMIRSFFTLGIITLTFPIASIVSTLLYFDMRIRKEDFDIEMQVSNC